MNQITLTLPPQAYQYIRQVLGARPHDEVRPLIASLEQMVAQQLEDPQAMPMRPNGAAGEAALHD
jgi:hypothetical protein